MTYAMGTLPIDAFDRELMLMARVAERCPIGPDFDPRSEVLVLFQALGEVSCTLNAPDAGPDRWRTAAGDLLTVLTTPTGLAVHFDVGLYEGAEWPDGTRVGGDGAYASGHHPHHLLAEVIEAAGWVAEWVLARTEAAVAASTEPGYGWLTAGPITELVARTWCLIDRLDLRESLRTAIREQMDDEPPCPVEPCGAISIRATGGRE